MNVSVLERLLQACLRKWHCWPSDGPGSGRPHEHVQQDMHYRPPMLCGSFKSACFEHTAGWVGVACCKVINAVAAFRSSWFWI
jgi:hypothetical protein